MTKKHPPAELPAWITKLTIGSIAEPRPIEKAAWRNKAPAEHRALVWLLLEARHPDRLFFSLGHEKLCERDADLSTSASCLRPITKARFIALVGDSLTLPWRGGKTTRTAPPTHVEGG